MKIFLRLLILVLFFSLRPVWTADTGDLKSKIKGLDTNFTADFSYSTDAGVIYNGKIHYQYPNMLNVQLSNGSVIATNGKFLWVYDPSTKVVAKQNVKDEQAGGLFYFLHGGYSVQEDNGRYIFSSPGAALSEVTLTVDKNFIKNVQFKIRDSVINMSFSNVVVNTSIKASLFNYKPGPDAQLMENPLNRIGNINIGESKEEKVDREDQ